MRYIHLTDGCVELVAYFFVFRSGVMSRSVVVLLL